MIYYKIKNCYEEEMALNLKYQTKKISEEEIIICLKIIDEQIDNFFEGIRKRVISYSGNKTCCAIELKGGKQ